MVSTVSSVSTELLEHLRKLYGMALEEIASGKKSRKGINGFTTCAIPAYIIAVTTVEAFVNEMFISPAGRSFFKGSEPEDYWTSVEKKGLSEKLILLPQKYFGRSFLRDSQPYQDMQTLIKLRNDLVHYKMQFEVPKYMKPLQQRHIALNLSNSWVDNISTSEGIRWAHNTVCETIKTMGSFTTSENHPLLISMTNHEFFNPIPESLVKDWFVKRGIELDFDGERTDIHYD